MCIVQYCIRDNKFEKIVSELNFLYLFKLNEDCH